MKVLCCKLAIVLQACQLVKDTAFTNSPVIECHVSIQKLLSRRVDVLHSLDTSSPPSLQFPSPRNNEREYDILNENGDHRDPWSVRKLKKVKEASEIMAGPKWKTFIRKIGAFIKKRKQRNNQAQYDAESYALNFDREEDGCVIPGFSSKFSAASVDQETRRNEL
ncbi:hypothetical protein NC651_016608 [Populus alba x Populus x berolinensis]|nr:hypothetical protein NC651_016608 [Populus alba x Populus x berolinensis]